MLWIIIFLIVVIFCIVLLVSSIYIEIKFNFHHDQQIITVGVRLYGIKLLHKRIDLADVENPDMWEKMVKGKSFPQLLEYIQNIIRKTFETLNDLVLAARIFLKRIHVHQLEWNTRFGTGEASSTGMAIGGIWTIKGSLIGFLDTLSNFECDPIISVIPLFQRKYIDSKIDCIVSIKIGQAMYALIKVIRKSSMKKEAYI